MRLFFFFFLPSRQPTSLVQMD